MKQVNLLSVKSIFDVVLPALLIALLFITPFVVSDELYNGVIIAKEFWFFGVVAAMLLYSGIRLLFKKGNIIISLNIMDILLHETATEEIKQEMKEIINRKFSN